MKVVGDKLKQARQAKGWTPEAAAKATKIKVAQILALESGDYSGFASAAYARGFVRIYAQALGIDEGPLLASLDGTMPEAATPRRSAVEYLPERVDEGEAMGANQLGMRIMGILAVLLVAIVGWYAYKAYRTDMIPLAQPGETAVEPTPVVPTETPLVVATEEAAVPKAEAVVEEGAAEEAVAAAPAAVAVSAEELAAEERQQQQAPPPATDSEAVNHDLTLQAARTSWVRVESISAEGRTEIFEGIIEGGTEQSFKAARFNLKIAIPAAVNIIWNGYNYGPHSNSVRPESFPIPAASAR